MRKCCLFLPFFLLLLSGGIAHTVFRNTAHDFTNEQCSECHAVTPEKGKREKLRMKAPIEDLCGRCHKSHIEISLSHPVGMAPTSAFPPSDMPLSWEGKMTCSTCHDIHASAGTMPHLLRRNVSGPEFCSACHTEDAKPATGTRGHDQIGLAHMKYIQDPKGGQLIDRISHMCLSCHDGSTGTASDIQVRSGSWRHGASFSSYDPQGSHPIGVRYKAAMKRGGLRPVAMLNSAIKLIDGKVGCRSCHDPFSRERHFLVIANTGSRLCLACHDK